MSAAIYSEPVLSVLVLDFLKKWETCMCLESVKRHIKVPYKVIYLHNGPADYPVALLREGLVDQLIQTKINTGLAIGTRDLFAACFSEYALYLQNDQVIGRDLVKEEYQDIVRSIGTFTDTVEGSEVKSVSVAGSPCGKGVYSERAHFICTQAYRTWEHHNLLGYHGAGPYHDGPWREAQIQKIYREEGWVHYEWPAPLVIDNGRRAVRQNPDGSIWTHEPDTKRAWLLQGPVKERHIYPRFSEAEWTEVLSTQVWPDGLIPEHERAESFTVPQWH